MKKEITSKNITYQTNHQKTDLQYKKPKNENLHNARNAKKDEFYTQLVDIGNEMKHYVSHFKNKVVYCNCDDPRVSNFFNFFVQKFETYGLKKLITTCYKNWDIDIFSPHDSERAVWLEYTGDKNSDKSDITKSEIEVKNLKGDGDFRSQECIELLKQSDIVVTNPPFSLFREYVAQLIEYDKKFIIIGDQNAIAYKEIFKFIKENKLWLGWENGGTKWFQVPERYDIATESRKKIENGIKYFSRGNVVWYTNLSHNKRKEELNLKGNRYTPEKYLKYDNYDAINVDKTIDIPEDYDGVMGVPITFLDKFNPEQFEIVGNSRYHDQQDFPDDINFINGKGLYMRILIRHKHPNK